MVSIHDPHAILCMRALMDPNFELHERQRWKIFELHGEAYLQKFKPRKMNFLPFNGMSPNFTFAFLQKIRMELQSLAPL